MTETPVTRSTVFGILWDDNDEFIFSFKEVVDISNNILILRKKMC